MILSKHVFNIHIRNCIDTVRRMCWFCLLCSLRKIKLSLLLESKNQNLCMVNYPWSSGPFEIGFGVAAWIQYIPRNMHMVFALLCFVVVIHWLIIPYSSGLLHWHCGNLTIAPVPAKKPWWIWINTSCEFIMNDCITKQSTTKPCAYFLGYTVCARPRYKTSIYDSTPTGFHFTKT